MTDKQTLSYIRALGLSVRKTPEGEYRINTRCAGEGTAYYTDDRDDAIDTARQMAGVEVRA